jgi:hypothetical protein
MAVFFYAVVGRIPGDDEDSVYLFQGDSMTPEELTSIFAEKIYYSNNRTDQNEIYNSWGTEVFINHILSSESPIEIL